MHISNSLSIFTPSRPTRPNFFIPGSPLPAVGARNLVVPDKYTEIMSYQSFSIQESGTFTQQTWNDLQHRKPSDQATSITGSNYSPNQRVWSILQLLTAIGIMIALLAANGCTKALPEASKKLNTSKAEQQADRNYSPSRR